MSGKKHPVLRIRICARCSEPVAVITINHHRRAYHPECATAEASEASRQIREKSGPYYLKWVENGGGNGRRKCLTLTNRAGGVASPNDNGEHGSLLADSQDP